MKITYRDIEQDEYIITVEPDNVENPEKVWFTIRGNADICEEVYFFDTPQNLIKLLTTLIGHIQNEINLQP